MAILWHVKQLIAVTEIFACLTSSFDIFEHRSWYLRESIHHKLCKKNSTFKNDNILGLLFASHSSKHLE